MSQQAISKDINDYVEGALDALEPGVPLPRDVFLYFPINGKIMHWLSAGQTIEPGFLENYRRRGLTRIWFLRKRTNPILEALRSPELTTPKREQAAACEARRLVRALSIDSGEIQRARAMIGDLLAGIARRSESLVFQIWRMVELREELRLEHAVDVATFTVLFALGFHRIEEDLLADLAIAGLLHDIGLTQLPAPLASLPWTGQTKAQASLFHEHVQHGVRLLDEWAPWVSPRVRTLMVQHHEKFNGTGYPARLQGFHMDDLAQLLAMADLLASIASGRWDGQRRSFGESFDLLEKLQRNRSFPEYFNPDLLAVVLTWARELSPSSDLENRARQAIHQAALTSKSGSEASAERAIP